MQKLTFLILASVLVFSQSVSYAAEPSSRAEVISQAELQQILAPIALYPDVVLSHILIAATYPLEVVQAQRWTANNVDLRGSGAVEAVSDESWDPSVRALVAFPLILKRMSDDLNWTQRLGEAFLQDEESLLASVQSLRQLAYSSGSLDDMDKVSVTREDRSIVIEPIEREIVYVPYYNSRTVYGSWPWASHRPVYWDYPYNDYYGVDGDDRYRRDRHRSSFYWGPRTHLSFGFFFNTLHWRDRYLVRIPYQHYRPRQYYNHRQIVRHDRARRWEHDSRHRRGVEYRNSNVRRHYRNREGGKRSLTDRVRNRVDRQRDALVNRQADRVNRVNQSVKNPRSTRVPRLNDVERSEDYQSQRASRRAVQERVRRNVRNQQANTQPRPQRAERNTPQVNRNAETPRRATPRQQPQRVPLPSNTVRTQRQQQAPVKTQRRAARPPKPAPQQTARQTRQQNVRTSAERARESVKSSIRDRLRKPN